MSLTASDHLKVSALQQIANMVGQMQSLQGNPQVSANVINNLLPLIQQFESSDPEFQQLGILLRQARAAGPNGPSPDVVANIAGQAQRMVALLRGGLPYRVNEAGERTVYDPVRGHISSPLFEKGEPITPQSVYGWRGSKKYPMGRAFPEWNVIEGWDDSWYPKAAVICLLVLVAFYYIKSH